MTQADLAALMNGLGLEWSDGTVGFVERGDRAVTVDEYVGLALCVGVTVGALLDPTGPAGLGDFALDLSGIPVADASPHGVHLPAVEASRWARGAATVRYDGADSFIIQATSDERGVR